ncbi:MAG: hypothetical protein ABSF00_07645 [Candidatus Bathyarchaeia archaeon]
MPRTWAVHAGNNSDQVGWDSNMKLRRDTRRALFLTTFLFGLLTWSYVIMVQMIHPDWVALPMSHIGIFPFNLRVDVTGIVAFLVSALSFFLWQSTPRERRK